MEQKLNKQSIDAMLSPSEFGSGTLYDVIINNGLAAFQNATMFDYACRKSVEIYIHYNDGVHSNNIMQMYKMIMGKSLYGWFHLCAIRIYGRRTPGYFFEHPERLWQKVALCLEFPESADEPSKRVSRDRAAGAVADLLRFYIRAFEDPQYVSLKPKAETFNKYYIENHVQSRLQLPPDAKAGADTIAARYADARSILAQRSACERAPNIRSISISPPLGVLFGVRRS